jgi:hypothetical protein
MEIGVAEAAGKLGVSVQRVHQLLSNGSLIGRRVGRQWILDEAQCNRNPAVSRPLSERMAWGLVDVVSGIREPHVAPSEKYRLSKLADRLHSASEPADLLRSWMKLRAQRLPVACAPADLADLAADSRVRASGIADVRAGMSAAGELEGYIEKEHWNAIRKEFLLIPSARPNVFVHVVEGDLVGDLDPFLIAADLAEHNGPREDAQVRHLLAMVGA